MNDAMIATWPSNFYKYAHNLEWEVTIFILELLQMNWEQKNYSEKS